MTLTTSKSKLITGAVVVALILIAVTLKLVFFPSLKDAYFAFNQRSLDKAPFGITAIRPTHFPKSVRKGILWSSVKRFGKPSWRMMGRNVSFQELIAAAYSQPEGRVIVSPTAPKGNFDFLVTSGSDLQEYLKTAIRKKLGFTARLEERNSTVLALTIQDSSLPGLKVSDPNTKTDAHFVNGRLQFTHMRMPDLIRGLEQAMKQPIVFKAEDTNYYDFSLDWNAQLQRQLENENEAPTAIRKILGGWGFRLDPDVEPVQMLVVRNAD